MRLRTCQAEHSNICGGHWQEAVGAKAAQALVRLLVGRDAGAAAAATTALRNVAEHPGARQALAAALTSVPAAQKVTHPASCAARAAGRTPAVVVRDEVIGLISSAAA